MFKIDEKPSYNGGLTREQFLFRECKVVAELMLKDMPYEEILDKAYKENIFQLPTDKSVEMITKACYRRLAFVRDKRIIELIATSDTATSKFAILYTMMCNNLIVRDFMIQIIGTKYSVMDYTFDKTEVNHFLFDLGLRIESVSNWSDATTGKIRGVLVKCLAESGYLTTINSKTLNIITPSSELINLIKDRGDYDFLAAFNEH